MRKNRICLFLALCLVLALAACGRQPSPAPAPAERHRVIIDTDMGADDAAALILAASSDSLEILGVTVLYGNVALEQAADNALAVLELCGREAPVYIGAEKPLEKPRPEMIWVHGKDGLGDRDLVHPSGSPESGSAVDFILDTVRRNPGEIELVALGPLTNVAQAVLQDPETMGWVKRIWVMGTCGFGAGNASPVAEFNVYNDAEAYDTVLRAELPMTVIGLDCCLEATRLSQADLEAMAKGNKLGQFMSEGFTKLNEAYVSQGQHLAVPDATAVAALLWPDYVLETRRCYGLACTDNDATYGQVILYREGAVYEAMPEIGTYNLEVVSEIDAALYKQRFMDFMTKK